LVLAHLGGGSVVGVSCWIDLGKLFGSEVGGAVEGWVVNVDECFFTLYQICDHFDSRVFAILDHLGHLFIYARLQVLVSFERGAINFVRSHVHKRVIHFFGALDHRKPQFVNRRL